MTRGLAACLSLLAACAPAPQQADSGAAAADAEQPGALVMATANIRCLVDDWDARLPILADELAALEPDIVALQEVCSVPGGRDGLAELLEAVAARGGPSYQYERARTHLAWDTYDEGIALASRRPLADAQVVDLAVGAFPRKAVVARVGQVVFAATHLSFGAERAAVRRTQLGEIRQVVSGMVAAGETAVIAGDFNESPDGLALAEATGAGFADAWATAHPDGGGETVPAHAPEARIDYLLVHGEAAVTDAGRFLNEPTAGVWASDHLGVWATIPAP